MKIVADPNIPFVREAFAPLGKITLLPGRQINAAAVRDADLLLIRSVTPVNAALLDHSRVQFVATATIGTDHVDEPYLARRGIGFASAAGSNANSVAEYVIAALLELADRHRFRLRDKTLGVIGVGHVGSKVVRYARALGLRVLENDPPRQRAEHLPAFVSLDRVLTEADLVTLHVPLDATTRHLLHRDNLEKFMLLNTARGAVVDNRALLKALDADRLPAVVLDVWENEPDISPELLDVVDLGTPHIAGYSFDGKVAGTRMIYAAACRHLGVPAQWQPALPAPAEPVLTEVVPDGANDETLLRQVIRRVYDIRADDRRLRSNVRAFDRWRADYPVRREFYNYRLRLRGARAELRAKFAALGFQLEEITS
jgi:erythronate-4-phosphate dehydrogenase